MIMYRTDILAIFFEYRDEKAEEKRAKMIGK